MTNKEDGDASQDCNPRKAALLAVHLVSQVLDEAYIIANAARDSGQPWRYLSMLKSFKIGGLDDTDIAEITIEASKGDSDLNENKTDIVTNVIATSTPQKLISRVSCLDDGVVPISYNEANFIGQGDEDIETQQNELTKSTSMFINHLFDMSDVERIVVYDDRTEVVQSTSEPNELSAETKNNDVESYVNDNSRLLETFPLVPDVTIIDGSQSQSSRSETTDYSFVADAFVADINRDVAFYIDDNSCQNRDDIERYQPAAVEETKEHSNENTECLSQKDEVALYENAYTTLNRDYEQGSEEDGFPVLQDPKGLTLQEVELMTVKTSDDELPDAGSTQKPDAAAPTVSAISGSRKSSLVRRCRIQGAKILGCLRGWWRRKTSGKSKDPRCLGAAFGMCPLSPDARRRASSMLDNRLLRSPSPSRPIIWKFNTVSEALVNSNRWKEYTYDRNKPEDKSES